MARRLPETLHLALMKGSRGLAHLLKQKSAGDLELLHASLAAAEQAGSHIYRTIQPQFPRPVAFSGRASLPKRSVISRLRSQSPGRRVGATSFSPACCFRWPRQRPGLGFTMQRSSTSAVTITSSNASESIEGLAWFPSRGVAHRIRGLLLTRQKAFAEASEEFARSLELLAAHGYKPDLARTHIAWANASSSAAGRGRRVTRSRRRQPASAKWGSLSSCSRRCACSKAPDKASATARRQHPLLGIAGN